VELGHLHLHPHEQQQQQVPNEPIQQQLAEEDDIFDEIKQPLQ
jgi:hypothetical protein